MDIPAQQKKISTEASVLRVIYPHLTHDFQGHSWSYFLASQVQGGKILEEYTWEAFVLQSEKWHGSPYILWLELSHKRGWIMHLRHVPREKRGELNDQVAKSLTLFLDSLALFTQSPYYVFKVNIRCPFVISHSTHCSATAINTTMTLGL